MSAIIYEKTPNGFYPTGQRTVSTFPSGLVRVDQSFVCRTDASPTHRSETFAVGAAMPSGNYPSMDGLKIFPEPQEKTRGDGFTEFIVSAYGRTNLNGFLEITPYNLISQDVVNIGTSEEPIIVNSFMVFTANKSTRTRVVVTTEPYSEGIDTGGIGYPVLKNTYGPPHSPRPFKLILTSTNKINYGYFSELTTTYQYV